MDISHSVDTTEMLVVASFFKDVCLKVGDFGREVAGECLLDFFGCDRASLSKVMNPLLF